MKKIYTKYLSIFLLILTTLLLLTSCSAMFQDKVSLIRPTTGSLGDLLSEKVEISQLETPKQVFISNGMSINQIQLSWSTVPYAVSYRLERAIVSEAEFNAGKILAEEDWEVINPYCYQTSYTDTVLQNPTYLSEEYTNKYYYRIAAENLRGNIDSSEYTAQTYGTLFAPSKKVSAEMGKSEEYIKIEWDKVNSAQNYEIYRTSSANGSGAELISRVPSNQTWYKDMMSSQDQGKDFYYKVISTNTYGNKTVESNVALGYSLLPGAPSQVSNVRVTNGRGTSTSSIEIAWDAASGIDIKYSVYRNSSVDSSFVLLSKSETGTSYTDSSNLKTNVLYYYYVQPWNVNEETKVTQKGPMSESGQTASNPAEGFILSPPTYVTAIKNLQAENFLIWNKALGSTEEQQKYEYIIYGSSSMNGPFDTPLLYSNLEETSEGYLKAQMTDFASYYCISTKNGDVISKQSDVCAPAPFAPTSIKATKKENLSPAHSVIPNGQNIYPVKITWSKPEDDEPYGYNVYRSNSPDSGYRKITDSPILGTEELYYIDNNDSAKVGKYYYYKVLSINTLEQGINYTDFDIGYGAITHEQYMIEYNKTVKSSQKKLTLMHKSNDLDKLGSETIQGTLSGSLSYKAAPAGIGARITMRYDDYADFYIDNNASLGHYFKITGNTNTSASMDASGTMDGTVICTGMYPGSVRYDNVKIKGGGAAGGTYGITPEGFAIKEIDWTYGEK